MLIIGIYCFGLWRSVSSAKIRSLKPIHKVDAALIGKKKKENKQKEPPIIFYGCKTGFVIWFQYCEMNEEPDRAPWRISAKNMFLASNNTSAVHQTTDSWVDYSFLFLNTVFLASRTLKTKA